MSLSLLSFYGQSKLCLYFTVPSLFDSNALSISFCRMSSDHVKIWVKVDDGKPRRATGVCVENNADVDDLVTAALEKEKLNVSPGLVTVEFEGVEIRGGRLATEFHTSDENPLLLKCPDECKGV